MRDYDEDNDGKFPTKPRSKPAASAATPGEQDNCEQWAQL